MRRRWGRWFLRAGVSLWLASLSMTVAEAAITGLRVSSNPHYLEVQLDGGTWKKVLLVGDSITQGWMELGTDFDQTAYVNALGSRKINLLMLWSFEGTSAGDQISDPRLGYDTPELWPWVKSGGLFRFTDANNQAQFNAAYFTRLRSLISAAKNQNIVVLITVHDGWTKTHFDGSPLNNNNGGALELKHQYITLANDTAEMPATFNPTWTWQQKHQYYLERFCAKLIAETAGFPNVIYEMVNEGEWYDANYSPDQFADFQKHFLSFFGARTSRLLIVEDDAVDNPSDGISNWRVIDFRGVSGVDLISLHQVTGCTPTCGPTDWDSPSIDPSALLKTIFTQYDALFDGSPVKPFIYTEPVPAYQDPATQRTPYTRLMWGTLLGGGNFVVQNDTSWGFADDGVAPDPVMNKDLPMLDREGYAAKFFNGGSLGGTSWPGVTLAGMAPNATVACPGTASCLSSAGLAALASAGQEYVVYSQSGTSSLNVNLTGFSGSYTGRFFNPTAGALQSPITVQGGARRSLTKPNSTSDWVLHLKRN